MNQSNLPQDESRRVMLADGHGDDEPPQPNDSSYGQSNRRSTVRRWIPKILIGTVLLALGFVIGYCINHQIKLEENSNPLQLISKEQGAIFLRDQNSPDLLVNPKQPCNDSHYCEKCRATVISSEHRPKPEGKSSILVAYNLRRTCAKSDFIKEPDCFPCNGSCISSDELRKLVGDHIKCNDTTVEVTCCHLVQMAPDKYCGKNGDLICKNNTEPPFCNCKCNWTGEMCDKMDVQKVMCNCFTLGKPIAYADSMKSCNDAGRPANWTECILDGKREDTAMNCICAPLNTTDIRFHLDEKKDLQNCSFSQS
ncbi:uncharacterized protein LOC128213549 isoform X2 [Mya arenaria]|uniref:uncharacterized protein LOC128213549 isoform X2 n=1 Tax=Mya arenaria TaxID=6604 RepID=UPI0022E15EC3|nr:uncharacterized protein LOC128213549 isoform X2 [Mya arenaria]